MNTKEKTANTNINLADRLELNKQEGVTQIDLCGDLDMKDISGPLEEHGYELKGTENTGSSFEECSWDRYSDCEFAQIHHDTKVVYFVAL